MIEGSCNCGACTFVVTGKLRDATACHCGQCRKQSGYVWASAITARADIDISGPVQWFASSAEAERGFCPTCGCFLFWRHAGETTMSVALGALGGSHGIKIEKHIFVADKGSYYDIADGLPQQEH